MPFAGGSTSSGRAASPRMFPTNPSNSPAQSPTCCSATCSASARIQTVHEDTNPRYWKLIDAFKQQTGYGLVVNTSFNVRGEPIVCTPDDAYKVLMRTEMDFLAVGNYLFAKTEQPEWKEEKDWREEFGLD